MITTLNSDVPLFECNLCTEQALFDYGIILSQLGRHDVGPRQIQTLHFHNHSSPGLCMLTLVILSFHYQDAARSFSAAVVLNPTINFTLLGQVCMFQPW